MKMHNVASIEIEQDIIQANDKLAFENRKIFEEHGVFAVDLVGAVGSGKTSLLEKLIDEMDEELFDLYLKYHFTICERSDLLGASHHILDVFRKD